MSISKLQVEKNQNKAAVLCCKAEIGTIITESNLEDPDIFRDLEESKILKLPITCLTIKQAIGKTLNRTLDALTPITGEFIVEKIDNITIEKEIESKFTVSDKKNILKIQIGEGKNINIEIPMNALDESLIKKNVNFNSSENKSLDYEESKLIRTLTKKYFKIEQVLFSDITKIEGTTLYLRNGIEREAIKLDNIALDVSIDIITKERYNEYSDTIMDVQPIATKELGYKLGSGNTRILDGIVMIITGIDEKGVQIGEFGSSNGILNDCIAWNRPGAPDCNDILIKTKVVIKEQTNMERAGPVAAHKVTEFITQEIRMALKNLDENLVTKEEILKQYKKNSKPKIAIVKEIMGQGAMHDNLILPLEPVGILGARANIDLGNLPIVVSPLEVLDGCIHALTCIGPASKECSRHYFREPLVLAALEDEDIDLCAVIFIGSPQINSEKFYVSERLGMMIEALDLDGVVVGTEGFGNNHIDFASHIEQIGMRNVNVVGITYSAQQGALVVGNKYMDKMIDLNKSILGIENEVLACNTLCIEDAVRAIAMLKSAISNEEIIEADRKWNKDVKENNINLIEASGIKIERANKI